MCSDSARHRSQDICPPISQIVLKNFMKISLIIECPEEILIELAIVLKISKTSMTQFYISNKAIISINSILITCMPYIIKTIIIMVLFPSIN